MRRVLVAVALVAWVVGVAGVGSAAAAGTAPDGADVTISWDMAEADIARGLDGELLTEELVSSWLGGMQGPGYVLGVDMIRTIDAELGRHATVSLVEDCRRLLALYNRAAWLAGRDGFRRPRFSDELAGRLASYGEDSAVRHPSVTLPPELARVLADYERAWRARDATALAALFAEDGFVLSSGHPPVRGRALIEERYRDSGGPLSLRALAFATDGDVGYIIGGYSRAEDEPDIGTFTLTLRRAADGRWLIMSDMDVSIR